MTIEHGSLGRQGHESEFTRVRSSCEQGLVALLVAATDEAAPFWLRQGLHTQAFWPARLKTSKNALSASGREHSFDGSKTLGALLHDLVGERGMVARAHKRIEQRPGLSCGLQAAEAASALGYEDLTLSRMGNFWMREGHKVSVPSTPGDTPPSNFKRLPYHTLQAFPARGGRGWGLRSSQVIDEVSLLPSLPPSTHLPPSPPSQPRL